MGFFCSPESCSLVSKQQPYGNQFKPLLHQFPFSQSLFQPFASKYFLYLISNNSSEFKFSVPHDIPALFQTCEQKPISKLLCVIVLQLFYTFNLKMQSPSQTFFLQNPNFPTIQSIEAQSEYSVDLRPSSNQTAIMQILLLSIELDRKDMIIDELQNNVSRSEEMRRSQIDFQHSDLKQRYEKMQAQNRSLIQTNAILRSRVSILQRTANQIDIYKQNSKYNIQLEQRLRTLQTKLKKTQQQKIESLQAQKQLKTEISKLQYTAHKQTQQKNKIRDLETEIISLKAKLQKSETSNKQNKHLLEKFNQEIHYLKESENKLIREYEEKIELIRVNEDLKKSQCFAASDEKIMLMSQEMNRMKQQLDRYREQMLKNASMIQERNDEIRKLNQDIECYEKQLQKFQKNHQDLQQLESYTQKITTEIEHKQVLMMKYEQEISNLRQRIGLKERGYEELEKMYEKTVNEEMRKGKMLETMRIQISEGQETISNLRAEIRKLKKSKTGNPSQCQICRLKINSATSISQKRSKQSLNLDELVKQAQKLKVSNSKIENLISYHELSSQNSIDLKGNSRITYAQEKC